MADRDALTARALIASLDPDYVELGFFGPEFTDGPLEWSGYGAARERARARTGERESVVCATGRVRPGSGAAPAPKPS